MNASAADGITASGNGGFAASGNGGFAAGLLDPDIALPGNIAGRDGGPAAKRYGVYRNNVVVGLMEAMRAAFPSLLANLGKEKFDYAARNFIHAHPPKSPMMQAYGGEFAGFLERFPPLRDHPYAADLAGVERAVLDAYHAADALPLDPATLAGADASALVLVPHPALALLRSAHPVHALFQRRDADAGAVDFHRPQAVAITRPGYEVLVREIALPVHAFLLRLAEGETLGRATETMLECEPEFDTAGALALAFESGCFRAPQS
jgi:hypothetical protein